MLRSSRKLKRKATLKTKPMPNPRSSAENENLPLVTLSHEKVAIRSSTNQPWILESGCVESHLEAVWRLRPGRFRTSNNPWTIPCRIRGKWSGKILHGDLARSPRLFKAKIGERWLGRWRIQNCRGGFFARVCGRRLRSSQGGHCS